MIRSAASEHAPGTGTGPDSGMADAILGEIAELLSTLLETGEGGGIGLGAMPMSEAERGHLERRLGQGEVSAVLTLAGTSEVWETSVSGVWWVRHRGDGGRIVAEEIFVGWVPDILATQPDDARGGLDRLRSMLAREGSAGSDMRATPAGSATHMLEGP